MFQINSVLIINQRVIFPVSYGTWNCIAMLRSGRHLFTQSKSSLNLNLLFPFLIVFFHLRPGLPTDIFPSGFPPNFVCIFHLSHSCYILTDFIIIILFRAVYKLWYSLFVFFPVIRPHSCLRLKYSSDHPVLTHQEKYRFLSTSKI